MQMLQLLLLLLLLQLLLLINSTSSASAQTLVRVRVRVKVSEGSRNMSQHTGYAFRVLSDYAPRLIRGYIRLTSHYFA
jgi:hypothetical protein